MSEYYIHSLIKEFTVFWDSGSSAEEFMKKLVHYQSRCFEKDVIPHHEYLNTVVNKAHDPDRFMEKYKQLEAKNPLLLQKFIILLSRLMNCPDVLNEFRFKSKDQMNGGFKESRKTSSRTITKHDVEEICTNLKKTVGQVSVESRLISHTKKSDDNQLPFELTSWSLERKLMTPDFPCHEPPALKRIGDIPVESQEWYLLHDVLQCLLGFNGNYIIGVRDDGQEPNRTFIIEQSISAPLKSTISEILVTAKCYSIVVGFVEDRRQYKWGRVNQAIAHGFENILQDYRVFIAQMEVEHRRSRLNFQSLLVHLQKFQNMMEFMYKIVLVVLNLKGGSILSALHDMGKEMMLDKCTEFMLLSLLQNASKPYFEMLETWIRTGCIDDPCDEFMIEDNTMAEACKILENGTSSDLYWKSRYRIKREQIPSFLMSHQDKILRAGKYLNTIRLCKNTISLRKIDSHYKEVMQKMKFTSLNNSDFVQPIQVAYEYSSRELLDLIKKDYDIINRLMSIKRYFLIEQGDFLKIMMDTCDEELMKPEQDILKSRTKTLVELAIRVCSVGSSDPYRKDISILFKKASLPEEMYYINTISTPQEDDFKNLPSDKPVLGMELLTLTLKTSWPVSLILNEKMIGSYQMLFRLLLKCKYVERLLCQDWIVDQQLKQLDKESRKYYFKSFVLRRIMLMFVQNLIFYMTNEVIYHHWNIFMDSYPKCNDIDDFMHLHWYFVRSCVADCMLTSISLMRPIFWLLETCTEFCFFIQQMRIYFMDAEFTSMLSPEDSLDYSFTTRTKFNRGNTTAQKSTKSFAHKIDDFDTRFSTHLNMLLILIPTIKVEDSQSKLHCFFNTFRECFIEFLKHDDRMNKDNSTNAAP